MENQKFSLELDVRYHEVNSDEQASPVTMLYYLEDIAIAHSEAVGYGIGRLKAVAQAWILNRWHLQMERYPKHGTKVIIETWPSKFERFYGTREFLIKDPDQTILGRATSLWIFYNTKTKRPMRIHPGFAEAYGMDLSRAIDDPFNQLSAIGAEEGDREQDFSVRRSDIDTNGHVNNANYLQWMIEAVPEDLYQNHKLTSLEIQYKKETTYGSNIRSKCLLESSDGINTVCRHVILGESPDQELAIAKTVWARVIPL